MSNCLGLEKKQSLKMTLGRMDGLVVHRHIIVSRYRQKLFEVISP